MPLLHDHARLAEEATVWRRDLHAHPELLFDLPYTAAYVEERLRQFGCDEVVSGLATSGVVAVIRGRSTSSGKVVGLRADMDALPIEESGQAPHRSLNPGRMHACGHDGHTAMLLGAARHLAATRDFDGTAVLVFQPAEEGGGGGRVMLEEGLLERFGIHEIYAMHNRPNLPVGHFLTRGGSMLAAADRFVVRIVGKGGHAAKPHLAVDPVLVASHMVVALQTILSRNVDPMDSVVLSVTMISGGTAMNVIPATAEIAGTIRTLSPSTRQTVEARFREIVDMTARLHRAEASVDWRPGYPVTINDDAKAAVALSVASEVASPAAVSDVVAAEMGAEDFSYMLEQRPGALVWIGNGKSAELHHPDYDFNDEVLPHGISFWVRLVETVLPMTRHRSGPDGGI